MNDYDTLDDADHTSNDDFPSIFTDIFKSVNWKVAIFLYLICIFVNSDLFIDMFLNQNQIDGDCPNTSGTMTQISTVVLAYIVVDMLVQGNFI